MKTVRVRVNGRVEECFYVTEHGGLVTVARTSSLRDPFKVKATDVDRECRWKVTEGES